MGYRSEVILAVDPNVAPAFMALTAKYPEVLRLCNDADRFESGYENEGDWLMHWSGIKWYESFDEIAVVQQFVNALEADDLTEYGLSEHPVDERGRTMDWPECFRFIRLGEDYEDIESAGHGFYDIGISRDISF
jgi:hypothetical protein